MEVAGRMSDVSEEGTAELKKLCEMCDSENGADTADGICHECEEYMCISCFRQHRKAKLCRDHIMIEIDTSMGPTQTSVIDVEKCKSHANETIRYYCRKHETVGCGDCMIPLHGACKPENIKGLSIEFHKNEEFKSSEGKLNDLTTVNDENVKKAQENRKANTIMLEKAQRKIQYFKTEINNYLQKAEAIIVTEAENIKLENDQLLDKLEQDCEQISSKATDLRRKLDTGLYQESALFIQTVTCKPDILDIERSASKVQTENFIKTFEFVPDKQMQSLIKNTQKLGNIAISTDKVKTGRRSRKSRVSLGD